ncbi:solute carrier family 2 facilitated glucose transporter member 1 protein [Plakobranchus ocellatus]|uniref:Solute carrier family 2 facilitated glucose transporter member 1 protein n=1 Tax=Plakobranchus ocellatus TaxID=259542 RepID=A0AAV4C4K1_9GAST|nr:solute carrier family 2 facilitated glucose transporter member 1 protein [Plakobranchus ocellatus]
MYKSTDSTDQLIMADGSPADTVSNFGSKISIIQRTKQDPSTKHVTFRLVLTIIGATMGSLQFGYNLGVINSPESLIKDFINATNYERTGSDLQGAALTNLWALTVAIYSLGGCVGGFSAGWWATKFGRKGGCLVNIIIGVIAGILMFASKSAKSYEMIIIGRLLIGVHCGLYSGLVPLYLSEMSTPRIRGAVGVLHQLALVTGMLISQILGFPVILGTSSGWSVLLGEMPPVLHHYLKYSVCLGDSITTC